ncbi:MAG TPA: Hsp20/alpha crystallin family protein [Myxococcales bacterium]|nr:Hsp20/alpha crystallin family protein [Myxococcales bacterium]
MAAINLQKNLPKKETWEPFRQMRQWLWDPFAGMEELPAYELQGTFMPAFEVKEIKDSYVFKADMPGIKEADLDISFTGDRLTVSGKREMEHKEEKETYYAYERSYGSFTRSFTLPADVNAGLAKAELKDGVLTILLPKTPEALPRKIEVKSPEKVRA